jgi:hypothetical protein
MKSDSFIARYLVNGWSLAPIVTFASGRPLTATVTADELAVSGVTPLFPYTLDGSGGGSRAPFLPVDSYYTGTTRNVDVRLSRAIPITERVRASLAFDVFNALNSQWATAVNTVAYSATSGIVKEAPGAGLPVAAVSGGYGTNARTAQASLRIVF